MRSVERGVRSASLVKQVLARLRRAMGFPAPRTALAFSSVVLIWYLVVVMGKMPPFALPSPIAVWHQGASLIQQETLWIHIAASMVRLLAGVSLSIGMAVPLGVLMGLSRRVSTFFTPILSFFNSISGIAWVPLAIIWFGFGFNTVLFILFNCIFFPVIYNTIMGIRQIPPQMQQSAYSLGASKMRVVTDVMLPGALPNVMTGIRTGMSYGWRALIAAEMIATQAGLGYMIFEARLYWQTETVVFGMIIIGLIWFLTDRLVLMPLEKRTIERWGLVRAQT